MHHRYITLAGGVLSYSIAVVATADVTAYADRASYQADAGPGLFEHFDIDRPPSVSHDFGAFVAETAPETILEVASSYLRKAGNGPNPHHVTFTFPAPILGFGVDVIDFGNPSTGELRVFTDTGSFDQVIATHVLGEPEKHFFFGITDSAGFSTITFANTTIGDSIGFDTLEHTRIPAPAASMLMLAGWATSSRRRRPSSSIGRSMA